MFAAIRPGAEEGAVDQAMDLPLARGELGTRMKPRVPQTHSLGDGD
jgi:hypothetical protein